MRSLHSPMALLGLLIVFGAHPNEAIADKPHPWLASAPGEFVHLIDAGSVQIQVDDERIRKSGKSALTVFQFVVDYNFRFQYEVIRPDAEASVWRAKISARMDQPNVQLKHSIFIPSTFQPNQPWKSNLMRHEFDHVSISTDPRLLKIIQKVMQQRREWMASFEQDRAPNDQDIRREIQSLMTEEVAKFEKLIQSQYDRLDQETRDGLAAIESRKMFFEDLYTVSGIERCHYELSPALSEFIRNQVNKKLSDVHRHYLP